MSKDSNSIAHNWVEKDFNSKYKGRIEQSRKMGEYSMTDTHDPDLAEGIEESNSEKDLLTDSLDSIEESENFRSVSEEKRPEEATEDVAGEVVGELNIASAITKPVKNSENERKLGNSKENKKKHSLKSTEKTTSVLNTASFSKVRSKMSYSELYRRKLHNQKISKVPEKFRKENMTDLPSGKNENKSSGEKKVIHEASDQVEGESSLVEIETVHNLHNGYANSGHCYAGLQTNESYQSHNGQGINNEPFNKELDWINYGTCNGNRSRQSYDYTSPRSELIRSSDYLNQAPITNLHSKNFHINPDEIGVNPKLKLRDGNSSRSSPPIQEVPTSVRSAPADIYMHHTGNSHYKMPYRRNSVCTFGSKNISYSGYGQLIDSMASTSSKAKSVKQGVTGYIGMYNKQHTYQPYTLCDYKRLKQITPGGLGPNTNSEEHKKKVKKAARQKEYAAVLRQRHNLDNNHWKKKPLSSTQKRSPKMQEANARRTKALQYAKAVPKPSATTKKQTSELKTEIDQRETFTLLDILRQRHEKERKAIEAVRKDLETKLKTR